MGENELIFIWNNAILLDNILYPIKGDVVVSDKTEYKNTARDKFCYGDYLSIIL